MATGWSIGRNRVEVDTRGPFLRILVDDEALSYAPIPTNLLGDYPLRIGKRDVVLRRVRNLDVARSEIWIDGVKVPPTEEMIPQRLSRKDATCKVHPKGPGGYRHPGIMPTAKYLCGVCRIPICKDCFSVDGVRCAACFEKATFEMVKAERALRIKGPLLGAALGGIVFIFGLALDVPKIAGGGLAAIALVVMLVGRGYWLEKQEAKERNAPR